MVKTSVSQAEWSSRTARVSSTTSSLSSLGPLEFSSTTLRPFTSFTTILESYNRSLSLLKEFTRTDVSQMNAVAANKVHDDQSEATTIQSRRV